MTDGVFNKVMMVHREHSNISAHYYIHRCRSLQKDSHISDNFCLAVHSVRCSPVVVSTGEDRSTSLETDRLGLYLNRQQHGDQGIYLATDQGMGDLTRTKSSQEADQGQ